MYEKLKNGKKIQYLLPRNIHDPKIGLDKLQNVGLWVWKTESVNDWSKQISHKAHVTRH